MHVQHKNCESGLAIIKFAAHTLVQNTLQVMWRWHSQVKSLLDMVHIAVEEIKSGDFSKGTVSQASMTDGIDRLPCSYLCCCSH